VWKIAQRIGLKGAITHEEEDGSNEQPRLYSAGGRVPQTAAESVFAAFDDALKDALRWGCGRRIADLPDTSIREALTAVGWPAERDLTPEQRAVEYLAVDWDDGVPPERTSLYDNMGDAVECRDEKGAVFLTLGSRLISRSANGAVLDHVCLHGKFDTMLFIIFSLDGCLLRSLQQTRRRTILRTAVPQLMRKIKNPTLRPRKSSRTNVKTNMKTKKSRRRQMPPTQATLRSLASLSLIREDMSRSCTKSLRRLKPRAYR
jgi:hypothetical protein